MKGLELARGYYEAYGKPMLENEFPELKPCLAVGLAGSGSECYGYDDLLSEDHDFEPAFCIFLPEEAVVDRRRAFLLERAYAKLPKEFGGFRRNRTDPVGGSRHGVIRTADFFLLKTGTADGVLSAEQWLTLPEYTLLEATNGAVFEDPYGEFTTIRKRLSYLPEDVRRKKLAGHLLLMGQAGQYNYSRCMAREDRAAAQLALFEFAKSALHCVYLLNRRYMPYYKWQFRGLRELPLLGDLAERLEELISCGNSSSEAERKKKTVEEICSALAREVREQGLCASHITEMEPLAYAVNNTLSDPELRNRHILCGV